ncbi:MAG: hypothetical protein RRY40_05960, partial [Oscillospiraceae bacterium]
MISNEKILAGLDKSAKKAQVCKKWFHENPELSLKEEKTSEKILEIVKSYNLPYEMVGDYGIIARLEGKN